MLLPHTTFFSLILLCCMLVLGVSACFTAPTSPQPDTAPLRSGAEIASSVGDTTRKTREKNPDLVLYATSIPEQEQGGEARQDPSSPTTKEEKARGTITISSSPTGQIILDARQIEDATPSELSLEEGRHEIQIRFPDGSISEVKTIVITKDAPIQLHFDQPPAASSTPSTTPPASDTKQAKP